MRGKLLLHVAIFEEELLGQSDIGHLKLHNNKLSRRIIVRRVPHSTKGFNYRDQLPKSKWISTNSVKPTEQATLSDVTVLGNLVTSDCRIMILTPVSRTDVGWSMMMQNLYPVIDVFSSVSQASGGSRYPIPGVCSSPDLRGHMTSSKSAFDGPLEKNSEELCRTGDTIHERRIWKILDKANSPVRVKVASILGQDLFTSPDRPITRYNRQVLTRS